MPDNVSHNDKYHEESYKERHVRFRKIMRYMWIFIIFGAWYLYRSHNSGALGEGFDWLVQVTGWPKSLIIILLAFIIMIFGFASFMFMIVSSSERNAREEAAAALKHDKSTSDNALDDTPESKSDEAQTPTFKQTAAQMPHHNTASVVMRARDKNQANK